jgi:hypothetical protein
MNGFQTRAYLPGLLHPPGCSSSFIVKSASDKMKNFYHQIIRVCLFVFSFSNDRQLGDMEVMLSLEDLGPIDL